ncbi:hypothetical protein WR25_02036 [Diploscapter pachys]|uniref:Uncharacterized protein n=1 Tax=Diploscapter pachys TaxID=2018661 RepID=A0A2A2K9M3_9BILA|nr:hypothetical protein WR25_02036 [Diploscapter pachys]
MLKCKELIKLQDIILDSFKQFQVLTDEEQKRADKIALMKLKSRFAKGNTFGSDALIVFVKWNDVREPVQLNKKWSIGKSVSEMISAVKAPQDSKARKSDADSVLDFSLSTGDTLKEGDTICLCE